jgi:hypothetical protein
MKELRLTIKHNPSDPADDLRYASRLRRDLWAHSPIEIDPDSPAHRTRRDGEQNAYFEFTTNYDQLLEDLLRQYDREGRVTVQVVQHEIAFACLKCSYTATECVTRCPRCGFRDISPCPYCNQEISRQAYLRQGGDLFKCPKCHRGVRLRFHEPLFDASGDYCEPMVVVESTEVQIS